MLAVNTSEAFSPGFFLPERGRHLPLPISVGFLFNHDQVHQVAHSLPVALALHQRNPALKIVIAYTNEHLHEEIVRLAPSGDLRRLKLVKLGIHNRFTRLSVDAFERLVPAAKLAMYRENLSFFASLDVLVVAEKTSSLLRTRYGLKDLRLIHTRHGAGDRAVGFNRASSLFDLVLVSGPKIKERLMKDAGVAPEKTAVVGYPKFDIAGPPAALKFSGNGRKTVLYNPHCSPHLSSWYRHGRAVLDYFVTSSEYNLIFAPHVMLFERPMVVAVDRLSLNFPGKIADHFRAAPNIHVDLGSAACTDMSYTKAADIYLGDVSSQVYEFLLQARPCLFLNPAGYRARIDPNFEHQRAGPIITTPADLDAGLEAALATHGAYAPIQKDMFERSIALESTPSSVRAAMAIESYIAGGVRTGIRPQAVAA